MNSRLRQRAIVGAGPVVSSIFERKYDAWSMSIRPSVCRGSSRASARGTLGVSMWTFVATDPRARSTRDQVLGAAVAVALCAGVAVPLGAAADLAYTQRALLDRVFVPEPASGTSCSAAGAPAPG